MFQMIVQRLKFGIEFTIDFYIDGLFFFHKLYPFLYRHHSSFNEDGECLNLNVDVEVRLKKTIMLIFTFY
jgi:hypothetical protein